MTEELWKDIDYKNIPRGLYSVSNHGRIRNNDTGKILKMSLDYDGYRLVTLSKRDGKGGHKTIRVNRLVALHFIDNPLNKPIVNHLNSDRQDNFHTNLEWATAKENTQHGIGQGNFRGINRKYTPEFIEKICLLLMKGYKPKEIQRLLNLSKKEYYLIHDIKNKRTWKEETEHYDFENGIMYMVFEKCER